MASVLKEPVVETFGWNIDATTTSEPPPQLPDGAPSGFSKIAARVPLSSSSPHDWNVLASEPGAYLVSYSRRGVWVYDAITGRERWHYLDSYNDLDEDHLAVGSGRLVAPTYDGGVDSTPYVFELASGRRLGELEPGDNGVRKWLPLHDLWRIIEAWRVLTRVRFPGPLSD